MFGIYALVLTLMLDVAYLYFETQNGGVFFCMHSFVGWSPWEVGQLKSWDEYPPCLLCASLQCQSVMAKGGSSTWTVADTGGD